MSFLERVSEHRDKLMHLGAGWILMLLGGLIASALGQALVLFVAWLKEDRDRRYPLRHTRDGWDAYATAFGILPGQLTLDLLGAPARAWLADLARQALGALSG